MKISDFPLLTTLEPDDFIPIVDSSANVTKKVTLATLIDYFTANIKTVSNIINQATLTASSSYSGDFLPAKAIDGNPASDWASLGESNPWFQATFSASKKVSKIRIVSRAGQSPATMTGNLTFSDGSSIAVTGIANNGSYKSEEFTAKSITWVRFTVTSGSGTNVGLGEFEVWGY